MDGALPPLTIEVYRGVDSSYQYYDMQLNALSFQVAQAQIVKSTASFVGGNFAFINKTAPSYDAGSCWTWDVASFTLDGTAIDRNSEININLNNNVEAVHTISGSKFPARAKRTAQRLIEITGTMLYENDDEVINWRANSLQRMLLHLQGQTTATSYNNNLTIDVPSFLYTAIPVNMGGPGRIEAGFTGKAKFNSGSGTSIEITLQNTVATY
jgi:hypothetical protein